MSTGFSDQQLEQIAMDLESERVERKESFAGASRDRVGQAICAFANDVSGSGLPGVVLVGLRDDGTSTGTTITDELLLALGGLRSDGKLLPLPRMSVERRPVLGASVAAVTVWPSSDPPVRFDGRVWIRVGSRRALASRDEERVLVERRQSGDLPFDRRPARSATRNDIDRHVFETAHLPAAFAPDVLEANERTTDERLRALHLLTDSGHPTNGALLLLGIEPRWHIPGAFVQFVRVDGTDVTDPIIDQKELAGPAAYLLGLLEDLVTLNIRTALRVGEAVDQRTPDYPATALNQLLANAILHRTYESNAPVRLYWFSDRVEISSPGGVFGSVTAANFGEPHATDYRNPMLAEGLKILHRVQRFGLGITLAKRTCAANDNPPISFDLRPEQVVVTVRARPTSSAAGRAG